MPILLLAHLSLPADVRGRPRETALPFALISAAAAGSTVANTGADAVADTRGPLRLAVVAAATTSGAFSIVCTGIKATDESVGAAVEGCSRLRCRKHP